MFSLLQAAEEKAKEKRHGVRQLDEVDKGIHPLEDRGPNSPPKDEDIAEFVAGEMHAMIDTMLERRLSSMPQWLDVHAEAVQRDRGAQGHVPRHG